MPEQVCPAFAKPPHTAPETAFGMSASAQTICGSLPPSSSTEPLRLRAQTSPTWRPTSTEPVKNTLAMLGASHSASPILPPPCTTRTRPSGTPARSSTSRIRSPRSGVRLAGFSTTPLPAARAMTTSSNGIDQG